jgi:hypothetical protein
LKFKRLFLLFKIVTVFELTFFNFMIEHTHQAAAIAMAIVNCYMLQPKQTVKQFLHGSRPLIKALTQSLLSSHASQCSFIFNFSSNFRLARRVCGWMDSLLHLLTQSLTYLPMPHHTISQFSIIFTKSSSSSCTINKMRHIRQSSHTYARKFHSQWSRTRGESDCVCVSVSVSHFYSI